MITRELSTVRQDTVSVAETPGSSPSAQIRASTNASKRFFMESLFPHIIQPVSS